MTGRFAGSHNFEAISNGCRTGNLLRNAHKLTATKIEHSHWSQSTSRIGYKKSNEFMSSLVCWSMHKPWMYRTDVDVKTTPKPWFCGLGKSLIPGQWKQI